MKRYKEFEFRGRLRITIGIFACLFASAAPAQPTTQEATSSDQATALEDMAPKPGPSAETPAPPSKVAPADTQPAPMAAPGPAGAPAGGLDNSGVALTRPGTFEIHVQGADLRGVLQLLSTQGKRNIIATKDIQGSVTADLYGVTFQQALEAVLASTGFDYIEENGFIYVYTREQKAALLKAKIKLVSRVFQLSYISAVDAQALITPALSEAGSIAVSPASEVGITPSKTEAGGNSFPNGDALVVRDTPEALDRVAELLAELDVKPDQVLIETTILSADLREGNKLGVNFNFLGGVDFSDTGSTWNTSGKPTYTPGNAVDRSGVNFRTDFAPVSGGVTLGIFGNDIAFFISALETVTDVTVIANPKLMVINKQRGEVLVGKRDGYLTTTLTETSATQTVEFLETGTKLVVRPFVARDGYIRMEVHPEDSDGSVENQLPSQTTTEVTSNILVKDGHTIVIGGLFRENTSTTKNQIPVLGNIPYLGALFKAHDDSTDRNEVIILITPHIISSEADEAVSRQIRDDAERIRMGQRKGLQWWSSERMAMSYLRAAKKAIRAGDREQALWDLDMALSIRPRLFEAIRIKEQLTQKAYWSSEVQHAASKYVVERMIMQELGKPYDTVIPPNRPLDAGRIPEDIRKALGIQPELPLSWPRSMTGQTVRPSVKVEIQVPANAKPADPQPVEDQKVKPQVTEPQSMAPEPTEAQAVEPHSGDQEPARPQSGQDAADDVKPVAARPD